MKRSITWEDPLPGRYRVTEWMIEPRATALVLVDLQICNVDPSRGAGPYLWSNYPREASYYYGRLSNGVLETDATLLRFFRTEGLLVVHVWSQLLLPGGREIASWSWRAAGICREPRSVPVLLEVANPLSGPSPVLAPVLGELSLPKSTLSPFNGTALDQILRNMEIENLVIAGVLTNVAVEATARDAGDRGYNAIVITDGSAAMSPEDEAATSEAPLWYVTRTARAFLDEFRPLVDQ